MSKMMNRIRQMCHQYKALAVMGLYAVVYLVAFYYLENRKVAYHIIHFGIDAYIPFCEYFIIPYLMWFGYVAITVCWLCIKRKACSFSDCRNDTLHCDIGSISEWTESAT